MTGWILFLLVFWIVGTLALGWVINHISTRDIREYHEELDRNLRAEELERLKRYPTRSRIAKKPDL